MFLGTYSPKLDEKGRLILPAKFRGDLAGGVVVTKGQEHCLFVFPRGDFEAQAAARERTAATTKVAREFNRVLFASAYDQDPDSQGRIIVPPGLRTYAGLTRDCSVIGVNTHLEVWDAATWTAHEAAQEAAFADQDEEPHLIGS